MWSMVAAAGESRPRGLALGPLPISDFRAVGWGGRLYWFQPWERATVRRLFMAWAGGGPVTACRVPRSLREDNDAWGLLIIKGDGCRLSLAERPHYYLSRLA